MAGLGTPRVVAKVSKELEKGSPWYSLPPRTKWERTKPGTLSERVAVLSSWGPGGALRRRCLPHTGTLWAWAPGPLGCRCALSSQGPCRRGHRQVLRGTWRPCLPLCSARPITSAGEAAWVSPMPGGQLRDQLPESSRRCLPRGEDPRDTGVPLTFSGGEKESPVPRLCR